MLRIMPQVSDGRDWTAAVSVAGKTRSPASPLRGRRAHGHNCGLRVRRSQRRSDGLRRLRGSQAGRTPRTARPIVEVSPRAAAVVHAPWAHGVVLPHVVVASVVMVMAGDLEAGEENGRGDEQDAGDDHNPRREPVEPIRFDWLSRWHCGVSGDRSRPGWCIRCFTHAEMMRWQRIGRARYNL